MHWTEEFFDEYYLKSSNILTGGEQTAKEIDLLIQKGTPEKEDHILDFACGFGRHSIELAKRGYENVKGLDITDAYLDMARERAKQTPNSPHFFQGNMQDFAEVEAYQLIFSMFSSMFYFDDHHNLDIIQRIFKALKPGGFFIIDYFNPINFLNQNKLKDWYITDDDYLILEKYSHNPISGMITNERLIICPDGRQIKRMYRLRDYTVAELRYHFENAGFEVLNVFGDFDGHKYNLNSPRQIFLLNKPEEQD